MKNPDKGGSNFKDSKLGRAWTLRKPTKVIFFKSKIE